MSPVEDRRSIKPPEQSDAQIPCHERVNLLADGSASTGSPFNMLLFDVS